MKKITIISFILLVLIIGAIVIVENDKNKTKFYKNDTYGFSFEIKNNWRPAVDISKIISVRNYSLYSSEELLNCPIFGDDENMFETDYSDEQIQVKQEALVECMINDPNYSKYDQEFKDYQLNWSFNNSDVMIFTDLDLKQENDLFEEYGLGLSELNLTAGHFIVISPEYSLLSFEEPKLTKKDDRIYEKRFIELKNNNLSKAYLFDTRYLRSDVGFPLNVEIPYIDKLNNENTEQLKSIRIGTNIFYGDKKENDFYQLIDTFQFINN